MEIEGFRGIQITRGICTWGVEPGLSGGWRDVKGYLELGMMEGKGRSRGPSDVWPYCVSVENRSNLNDAPLCEGRGLILRIFPLERTRR